MERQRRLGADAAGRHRGRRLAADTRGDRAGPADQVHDALRHRRLRRAAQALGRRPRVVLGRGHPRPRRLLLSPLRPGPRRVRWAGVAEVVHGRQAEHRPDLHRPLGQRAQGAARQGRADLGGRAGRGPPAHLRRPRPRGRQARPRAPQAGREARRRGRRLPADVPGGGDRAARDRQDRRGHRAPLQRLRRRCRGVPAERRRGAGAALRRRLLPARQRREDEGGRRRGAQRVPDRRAPGRAPARGARDPLDARPRQGLGAARRGRAGEPPDPPLRPRPPDHGHLHLGHDREAEGCAPQPRRVPRQGRPGHGLGLRPGARRHDLLDHRHRLDDGSLADLRQPHPGRHDGPLRRHPGHPGPTASGG